MRKWVCILLLTLLIVSVVSISSPFQIYKKTINKEGKGMEGYRIVLAQDEKEGKKGETDPHFILILKQMKEKVDAWLKSLNERIEREDITHFEVRFLEILRNILEWVKEKIDAKIESSDEEKREKKEKGGIFRETHQGVSPLSEIG
jgi:hypothetical protein